MRRVGVIGIFIEACGKGVVLFLLIGFGGNKNRAKMMRINSIWVEH